MVVSMFNNLKAKIHSESKNGLPSPLKYFGFYVTGHFGTTYLKKNQKIVHLTNPGSFFSLQSLQVKATL